MWMAASAHTVWFEDRGLLKPLDLANRLHGGVRLLTRPKAIGLQGAFGADPLWELTCGVKEHLLRINPDTGALTAVGQFAKANYCDAVTSSSHLPLTSACHGSLPRRQARAWTCQERASGQAPLVDSALDQQPR